MKSESNLWVELPDCNRSPDKIPLKEDLSNASSATCKMRPGGTPSWGSDKPATE